MKIIIYIILCSLYSISFAQIPDHFKNTSGGVSQSIDAFAGDWVGTGWEIRFEQSAGDFGKQFSKGKVNLPFENEKIIMSLMVTHTTHLYLNIDKTGNVTGKGIITYDLIPNLCGLAALSKQVNEAINMMDKIQSIFKWEGELSKKAINNFNRGWTEEYANFAGSVEEFSSFTKQYVSDPHSLTDKELTAFVENWCVEVSNSEDIRELASSVLLNRCATGQYNFGTEMSCSLLGGVLNQEEVESLGKVALD